MGGGGIYNTHVKPLEITKKLTLKIILHEDVTYPSLQLFQEAELLAIIYAIPKIIFSRNVYFMKKENTSSNRLNNVFEVLVCKTIIFHIVNIIYKGTTIWVVTIVLNHL